MESVINQTVPVGEIVLTVDSIIEVWICMREVGDKKVLRKE